MVWSLHSGGRSFTVEYRRRRNEFCGGGGFAGIKAGGLTPHCRRLGYLGANSTLPPAFWFAGGRRHHAAVAKRVKATVSAAVTLIQI